MALFVEAITRASCGSGATKEETLTKVIETVEKDDLSDTDEDGAIVTAKTITQSAAKIQIRCKSRL